MRELPKKIMIFRDVLDLSPCDGLASTDDVVIGTTIDLQKLFPEIIPTTVLSELKMASKDQVLVYFSKALQAIRESWMMTRGCSDKIQYDADICEENIESKQFVGIVLARLDSIDKIGRRKVSMTDKDAEKKGYSPESNNFRETLPMSYMETGSCYSASPATPTSVLSKFISNYRRSAYHSPSLLSLRAKAVSKLVPADVKRLSFHVLSHIESRNSIKLTKRNQDVDKTKDIGCYKHMKEALKSNLNRTITKSDIRDVKVQSAPVVRMSMNVLAREQEELRPQVSPLHLSTNAASSFSTTPPEVSGSPNTLLGGATPIPVPVIVQVEESKPALYPPTPISETIEEVPTPPPPPPSPVRSGTSVLVPLPMAPVQTTVPTTIASPPSTPLKSTEKASEAVLPLPGRVITVPPPLPSPGNTSTTPPLSSTNTTTLPPPPPPSSGAIKAAPPPPPPAPPPRGIASAHPPPPSIPLGNGATLPPPPGSAGRSLCFETSNTKLKRSSQICNLYRLLMRKIEGPILYGSSAKRSKIGSPESIDEIQGMADVIAEVTSRSAYFKQIEEDVRKYENLIIGLKDAISSFQTKDMSELRRFHKHVEFVLDKLTDETKVLLRFDGFPIKKLETLRIAASLYSQLDIIISEIKNWKIKSPLSQLLEKVERYFDKIKRNIDSLEKIKNEEPKKFVSHNIHFDFDLIIRTKEAMVDLSSSCIELGLKERREAKAAQKKACAKVLWQTFQLAYRVYIFAGGHDDRAEKLTKELAYEIEIDPP